MDINTNNKTTEKRGRPKTQKTNQMKRILLILFLSTATVTAQITVKTDEFTGEKTMSGAAHTITNSAGHISAGMVVRTTDKTYVVISVSSNQWVHLTNDTAHAISGAQKKRVSVTVLKVSSDTEIVGHSIETTETIGISLSTHLVDNPFLIRIGTVVYTIPEQMVADIKDIGRRLQ